MKYFVHAVFIQFIVINVVVALVHELAWINAIGAAIAGFLYGRNWESIND